MKGKVALVTGAAQGIGEAVARALAESGVSVAAVDQNERGLRSIVTDLEKKGLHAKAFAADVGNSAAVEETVGMIERDIGPIDYLVNVAGVLRTGLITSLSDEDWEKTFSVNTAGVFHVSRSVAGRMITRRNGSIVTVGSNAACVPRMQMAAYAASKAAALMFTKCLGLELAEYNIRCNIVSPGSTDTPMQRSMWSGRDGAQAVIDGSPEAFKTGIPLGRLALPADIANAVLFLLSESSRHITMHDLRVDGGATLGV
ncbi:MULTISPECIES: 2,3-dihydro-2,3-dihydroxybenzoate dehydrogenase [Bacillus]|uniref:2,3-dihydro-2,3-dihydroxybenzoate dehydrogenase n=1 Tax=Bacillus glycinifermentans TaxID=1664069 RepID=A0AAJ3Z1E8_9BACI|nr:MULTISPECIES: 2,3-dihydro-2,3-dihydroxybenzoate dehydrogenase [Bacillus]KKB74289.1 2,3-dihydroxybenzoate-2,3-dehydrogenase [Bacillus sp. TH008]MBU8787672.1 2,3-dihydro-2,3-dihydroxybenzoate dehydrogenase [Bacillus glycinifermentans]MDU0071897.1 2,3-dihydro-2,3-dihydroxybenzoate dehydrogenase [Bacillus sp. IG6]MED8019522.1 2,3-dihydro-2,3-dihydroxybenzoate dehydrogenase [Bacillus glycinifermentans]NUJ17914.1 2,3-dihydro-2,3-dihydroxybenzoate dehydrogenase [Bacillus glycinifermentans]